MSYKSFWQNVPGIITQPTGIAALASLGIHGAIALIVPLMPANSSSPTTSTAPEAVGLMELNASDQARLPQTIDNSQIALQNQLPLQQPQLPLQQQITGLEPNSYNTNYIPIDPTLAAELNKQPSLPVIPTSASNYNLSIVPQRQSLANLYKDNSGNNNLQQEISNLKARDNLSASSSILPNEIKTQTKNNQYVAINRLPELSSNIEIPAEAMKNPSADAIDTDNINTDRQQNIPLTNIPQTSENAEKLAMGSQKLLEKSPEKVSGENQSTSEKLPVNNGDAKTKINEKLVANLKSFNNLRAGVKKEFPNVKEKGVIRETITNEMEGLVLGRLVVDGDGKILDIKFHEGSGSTQLQTKAREFFKANPPQSEQKVVSSYPFQLQFRKNNNNVGEILKTKPVSIPLPENLSTPQNTSQQKETQPENTKVEVKTLSVNPENNSEQTVPKVTVISAVESNDSHNTSSNSSKNLLEKLRKIREGRHNK